MLPTEQLKYLLEGGENSATEFKSAGVSAEHLAREMVALANSNGGSILVGVEDDGSVSGVADVAKMEELVAAVSRQNVIPALQAELSIVEFAGKKILWVKVPKGPDKPYQTNKHLYYVRVGTTNRVASQSELMRLFQQAGVFHYDATGVPGTSITDLNLYKINQYFERYQIDFSAETDKERLLQNADMMTTQRQVTVAGLLLFGIDPQRYLHSAYISFAHFAGMDVTADLIDKQNIGGNLDYQIETALALIKNHLREPSVIEGARRQPILYRYPDKVFRELLVNACAHRNYAISGSQIRVFLFDDRLEFHSPGKLPNAITTEKIIVGVTQAVNPILVKFLHQMLYIDKLGRGIPTVWQEAVRNHKTVTFEEWGETFIVRLFL